MALLYNHTCLFFSKVWGFNGLTTMVSFLGAAHRFNGVSPSCIVSRGPDRRQVPTRVVNPWSPSQSFSRPPVRLLQPFGQLHWALWGQDKTTTFYTT